MFYKQSAFYSIFSTISNAFRILNRSSGFANFPRFASIRIEENDIALIRWYRHLLRDFVLLLTIHMSCFIYVVSSYEQSKFRHFAVVRFVIFLNKVTLFSAVFFFVVRIAGTLGTVEFRNVRDFSSRMYK